MRKLFWSRLIVSAVFRTVASAAIAIPLIHYKEGRLSITPLPEGLQTDATVVLTGSPDRIPAAYADFQQGTSNLLFISGLPYRQSLPPGFPTDEIGQGRIFIDDVARNTIENGINIAHWIKENNIESVSYVTSFNHALRAQFEIARHLQQDVKLYYRPLERYFESTPGKEKLALLCRLYETGLGLEFCYTAKDWWVNSSWQGIFTPPVTVDAPVPVRG